MMKYSFKERLSVCLLHCGLGVVDGYTVKTALNYLTCVGNAYHLTLVWVETHAPVILPLLKSVSVQVVL